MALNLNTDATFTGRITVADVNYPYGSSKDETSPGAADGTQYIKKRADDILGFQQALLTEAVITPSGNPDTALVSDYLDALKTIISNDTDPDYQSDTETTVVIATGDTEILESIDLGTVNAGSVISVSGNFRILSPVEGFISSIISCSGTAAHVVNGETSGSSRSSVTNHGVIGPSFYSSYMNVNALINVTATGTLVINLSGAYTGVAASESADQIKLATAYLTKKA